MSILNLTPKISLNLTAELSGGGGGVEHKQNYMVLILWLVLVYEKYIDAKESRVFRMHFSIYVTK